MEACPGVGHLGRQRIGVGREACRRHAPGDGLRKRVEARQVQERFGCDAGASSRVRVIPNGAHVDRLHESSCHERVVGIAHAEEEQRLNEVLDRGLDGPLELLGVSAELREVLQAEAQVDAGGAVGRGHLLHDFAAVPSDVMRLVDVDGDPGPFLFRPLHLPRHLRAQHAQDEHHARLGVVDADRRHVRVDDQDVAALDDFAKRQLVGVLAEEPADGRHRQQRLQLVDRRIDFLQVSRRGRRDHVGHVATQPRRDLVEVREAAGPVGGELAALFASQNEELVDVVQVGGLLLAFGDGDGAEDRVVQEPLGRLEQLPFVHVGQRTDDHPRHGSRFHGQRAFVEDPQRVHPEPRAAEVEVPDPLAASRRHELQRQPRHF